MKRLISMGITVALLFSMCACGGKSSDKGSETEGKKIFTCYDLETQNFAEAFNEEEIVSVIYRKNYETSEEYTVQEDKEQIGKLFDALSKVRVLEKVDEMASDSDDSFIFTLPTAQAFTFSFNQHHLVIGQDAYELTDDKDLWKMADKIVEENKKENNSKVNIIPSETKNIVLEDYQTSEFSMKIPQGWTVTTGGTGMIYSIRVYDSENPVNQIFVLQKAMPLLHDNSMRSYYELSQQMYGGNYYIMADAPALESPSTENFYCMFSEYADFAEKDEASYSGYTFPRFHDFSVTESFESNSQMRSVAINPALLRATFTDASGRSGEGMFTADVVDFAPNSNMGGLDGGYYMAYNIMAVTAEKDTLINWEEILCKCLSSLEYSQSFVNNAIQQSNETVTTANQLRQTLSETSDMIMSSWEKRNRSQDIISQKQSDATLGYERIYDSEKGEIYRAPNGWSDKYGDDRYKLVTDDNMYTEPLDGWIEW